MKELEKQHLIWAFYQASSNYGKQSLEADEADRAKFLEGMAVGLLRAADIVADTKKPAAGATATDAKQN